MRIPSAALQELRQIAHEAWTPPSTLARAWLIERIEAEKKKKPVTGDNVPTTTPVSGSHIHVTSDGKEPGMETGKCVQTNQKDV